MENKKCPKPPTSYELLLTDACFMFCEVVRYIHNHCYISNILNLIRISPDYSSYVRFVVLENGIHTMNVQKDQKVVKNRRKSA